MVRGDFKLKRNDGKTWEVKRMLRLGCERVKKCQVVVQAMCVRTMSGGYLSYVCVTHVRWMSKPRVCNHVRWLSKICACKACQMVV